MTLLELAERCEKATGPDRELDAMLAVAVDFVAENSNPPSARSLHSDYGGSNSYADIGAHWPRLPRYTASLDAAMTLVPDGCLATVRQLWDGPERHGYAIVSTYSDDAEECDGKFHLDDYTGLAATPALALCAAALKARAEIECVPNTPEGDG
jgi:hypothetical protein